MVHRLILKELVGEADGKQRLTELALRYLELYPEMPSAILDITPYLSYVSDRAAFVKDFETKIEERKVENSLR